MTHFLRAPALFLPVALTSALLFAILPRAEAQAPAAPAYRVARTVAVGGEGGWDFLSVDHAGGRLYASHGTQVEVLDLTTLKSVGVIPNTPRVHDILVVPRHKRGFVSCGGTNSVTLFDPTTLRATGTVAVGTTPDAMLYDAFSDRVFVFNHGGGTVTVLDPATGKAVGTVEVGGALEVGATDGAGTIFVNVEDKSEVVAIDARKLTVKHRWPLAPGEEPTGLGYDATTHRLFSACGNKLVVALDARTGKLLGTSPSGDGSDGLVVDERRHLALASNGGDSTITVLRTDGATFPLAQTVPTARGARTIALDAVTGHVFLPTATYGPAPAPTTENPHPRHSVVQGTFRILEIVPAP